MNEALDLYESGDYRKALAAYRKYAKSENAVDRRYRWAGIGECYMHLKQFDAAKRAFDRHVKEVTVPDTEDRYHWAGSARWLAGRHAEATAVWNEALKCTHTDSQNGDAVAPVVCQRAGSEFDGCGRERSFAKADHELDRTQMAGADRKIRVGRDSFRGDAC